MSYYLSKRIFDIMLSIFISLLLIIPIISIFLLHTFLYKDSFIYWSKRIGINNSIFLMPKIRTMISSAPDVATHLMIHQDIYITKLGSFLRLTSMDEILQLWSIAKGEMSFVGPRPALYNQKDLIDLRNKFSINKLVPGVTGLAQINGRDSLSISDKVDIEKEYLIKRSFFFDFKIIIMTFLVIFKRSNIKH